MSFSESPYGAADGHVLINKIRPNRRTSSASGKSYKKSTKPFKKSTKPYVKPRPSTKKRKPSTKKKCCPCN